MIYKSFLLCIVEYNHIMHIYVYTSAQRRWHMSGWQRARALKMCHRN